MSSALELHSISKAKSTEPGLKDDLIASPPLPQLEGNATPLQLVSSRRQSDLRSREHIFRERIQLFALYWCMFTAGWNDGSAGPLIPRIQSVYHVGFAVVSLIFVFACVGFIGGAIINVPLTDRLGFGKMITLGNETPISPTPANCFSRLTVPSDRLHDAVTSTFIPRLRVIIPNGYIASLKHNPEIKMGLLHGAYGAGALASPLVATQFAQLPHWSFHYLASLGIALINAAVIFFVFRLKTQDECLATVGEAAGETGTSEHSTFRQIMALPTVHLLAFFILVYVGVEVTIGGWIVTFMRDVRGGGASSGYVSAGFFGGLMTGRIALLWLNQKIGERRVIYVYSLLAIAFELVVWLVPSLVGDAVAVSIVGVLLGPIYPLVMNHTGRVLPRWLLTGAIGWIAGFGQAGSAVFPFITGAIASKTGIKSLQPLLVAMMAFMLVLWWIVPGHRKLE
ncbi:MFS domain-containing protein [Mycena indigotica]|uniref:MFS domain-containing protein n=1 Tax=Mycena indigotica TaxID=2126181 RepID=A0A8H6TEH6_9AGAR|nr:MFS domain-containing protein [Mycena indigotica]KAF7316223.1 MFS domain-containing protein [Mycena indigotica]